MKRLKGVINSKNTIYFSSGEFSNKSNIQHYFFKINSPELIKIKIIQQVLYCIPWSSILDKIASPIKYIIKKNTHLHNRGCKIIFQQIRIFPKNEIFIIKQYNTMKTKNEIDEKLNQLEKKIKAYQTDFYLLKIEKQILENRIINLRNKVDNLLKSED